MIYGFELYLLVCVLFLAGKDADSQQLKDKTDNPLTRGRVNRWHRDGVALYALNLVPLLFFWWALWWQTILAAGLIRLAVYDLAFNHWASLQMTYLGGTAITDRIFVGIFGINGAVRKSITFSAILVAGNILNHFL
jgi:hypothetical protein